MDGLGEQMVIGGLLPALVQQLNGLNMTFGMSLPLLRFMGPLLWTQFLPCQRNCNYKKSETELIKMKNSITQDPVSDDTKNAIMVTTLVNI